jgi:serine/threonine protein kinase
LRERLETAAGILAALSEVHAHGVVHRNVCPSAVVIGFDHQPRLTDFDRAYIEGNISVFEGTAAHRDPAFIAPELANISAYEFDSASDMYSFGALLYQLLTDRLAFANAEEARAAGGCPALLPSDVRQGVDARLDELVLQLLTIERVDERPTAQAALSVIRQSLDSTSGVLQDTQSLVTISNFEPGGIVDGVWRVDALLGQGSFSKVYRVFHLDHQKMYAMKLLTNLKDSETTLSCSTDANFGSAESLILLVFFSVGQPAEREDSSTPFYSSSFGILEISRKRASTGNSPYESATDLAP